MNNEWKEPSVPPTPESPLDMEIFRSEIQILVDTRKNIHQEVYDSLPPELSHAEKENQSRRSPRYIGLDMLEFSFVDPKDLTENDARMWNAIKSENYITKRITKEEYDKYSEDVDNSNSESRKAFKGVIAQKLLVHWFKEE